MARRFANPHQLVGFLLSTYIVYDKKVIGWIALIQTIGGTLLGYGIWLAVDSEILNTLTVADSAGLDRSVWEAAVYMSITVGCLVFLVGFAGFRGASAKDKNSLAAVCLYNLRWLLFDTFEVTGSCNYYYRSMTA